VAVKTTISPTSGEVGAQVKSALFAGSSTVMVTGMVTSGVSGSLLRMSRSAR